MLFNSLQFLIFFPLMTGAYFLLPHKYRWILLLTGSCYFYMAFIPLYIFILGFTIVIDYIAGIIIENAVGVRRKMYLSLSLMANIGVLAVFKYYNFLIDNATFLLQGFALSGPLPHLSILLPIGLSFHTFQAMSYTIEVYRGVQKAERHFGIYSLYVMFYPQLVAGPIERPQNLLHQFREEHTWDYRRVSDGLSLMLWGLFKKVVIADRLAIVADRVFSSPYEFNGAGHLLGVFFFTFQIFCDFSGYSDMAIGAAQVMGITLMKNFDSPYHSQSIAEFWRRWHISLSTWFRDYLYISLGGNRVSQGRYYANLFIVFLVSGLWHGANWTFVIWGALHGTYLILSIISRNARETVTRAVHLDRYPRILGGLSTLTTFILVSFAWIFFRATSTQDAFFIIYSILTDIPSLGASLASLHIGDFGVHASDIVIALFSIGLMECVHIAQRGRSLRHTIGLQPVWIRWSLSYGAIAAIIVFGVFQSRTFIYFQF